MTRGSVVTLLFVHGGGFCQDCWDPIIRRLKAAPLLAGVDFVTFDFTWHGGNFDHSVAAQVNRSNPDKPRVDHPARDITTWAPQQVWKQVQQIRAEQRARGQNDKTPLIGVGHSMGAMALWKTEVTHPGTFAGLSLFEPGYGIRRPENDFTVDFLVALALRRKAKWPSRVVAEDYFYNLKNFARWDRAALAGYLRGGLIDEEDASLFPRQYELRRDVIIEVGEILFSSKKIDDGGSAIAAPRFVVTTVVAATAVAAPVASAIMTPLPPHLLSSIDRINAALEVAVAQPPPATGTLRVCQATEDEWNAFVDSDGHIVRPNFLEWFADTGEIHIIEFADASHENYICEFTQGTSFAEQNVCRWLKGYMAAKNSQGRRWCPDLSYGPRRTTPGSVLPPGVPTFDDFRTIKIEIGVSQPWGMAQGQLDHKAISIWAVMPGVEYVLCVKFDPDFANAEYKLYNARVNPLVQLAPLPIVAQRTVIQLDGRRILSIPPGMALPIAFPATLSVDLYSPLVWAMR